jgi:hypothetical protein
MNLDIFKPTLEWIRDDFKTNPVRFSLEVFAWALSLSCSIGMAITVPNPPLHLFYPAWVTGCGIYAWAAYSRKSFGMLANYMLLTTIDGIALIRMWL